MGRHKYVAPNFDRDICQAYLLLGQTYMGRYLGDDSALHHPWSRIRFGDFPYLPPLSGRLGSQN